MAKPDTRIQPVLLQPVAAPVDTFVKTAKPEESNLWQLAQSLKGLNANLDGLMAQRAEDAAAADKLAGEQAFYKNNQTGYDEGVKQGLIPAFASKNFVESYKRAEGSLLGMQLATKFKTAYDAWDGKNSSDPNAFNTFYKGWLSENIPENTDKDILQGLLPHVRNITQGGMSAFDNDRHKNMYNGSVKAHAAIGKQAVDQATLEAAGNAKGLDTDGLYTTLMGMRSESLKTLRTEDVDKDFVDNITTAALERAKVDHAGARKLLTILDKMVPGENYRWSDTKYGREQKLQTMGSLDGTWKTAQAEMEHKRKEQDRTQLRDSQTAAIRWIIENPDKPIPEEVLAKGNAVDGTFRVDVLNWQKAILQGSVAEDPKAITQLYADILSGGGMQSVRGALATGIIRDGATLKGAFEFAEKVRDKNSPVHRAMKGPVYDGVRSAIKARTTPDSVTHPWAADGMSDAGLNAVTDYQMAISRWSLANPEATDEQLYAAQRTLGEAILGGLPKQSEPADRYTRTPQGASATGLPQPQATQPSTTPGARPQATPQDAARQEGRSLPEPSAPAAPAVSPAQRQGYLNGRSPEERLLLENTAKQRGVPVDSLIDGLIRRGGIPAPDKRSETTATNQQASLGFDPQAVSNFLANAGVEVPAVLANLVGVQPAQASTTERPTPSGPMADAIRAAFKANPALAKTGDPDTEELLSFIGRLEAPAGYNQMYGESAPSRNLVGMTINEVLALQDQRVREGSPSSVLGGYQFHRKTLRGLVQELGLTGNEKFDERMQDRLGMALLERRGYSEWKAGKLSTKQFANNLAQEWAALPTESGKSHYDGDGLNKALTSRGRFTGFLDRMLGRNRQAPAAEPPTQVAGGKFGPNDVYGNIAERDGRGEDQLAKFRRWNPDPVGNHETNLKSVKEPLQKVFAKAAQDNPNLRIVIGAGVRSQEDQDLAVKWGWSKTRDSHHSDGNAMDVWVLDERGRVTFDEARLDAAGAALKKAASELGIKVRWGGDWKSFKDRPHFELAD